MIEIKFKEKYQESANSILDGLGIIYEEDFLLANLFFVENLSSVDYDVLRDYVISIKGSPVAYQTEVSINEGELLIMLENLDNALLKLGFSDSSVMYASHIRDEFDACIDKLNALKESLGVKSNDSDWYFDDDNIENLKVIEELEGDGL